MTAHPTPETAAVEQSASEATVVIEPVSGWTLPSLRDIWGSADLVYFLAKRDVTVRYKQTVVGALWAVLQPLLLAGVFSVFLGQLTNIPSEGTPYALFALAGMTMWLFVANATSRCADSTLQSANLISRVYFPRIAVPLSAVMVPVIDFVAGLIVLVTILTVAGETPEVKLLLAPAVFVMALAITLGIGLWLSAIVVRYRDVSLVVPFLIQVTLFVTPILYPLSLIPDDYQALYSLNPLVGVLEAFRWTVLPDAPAPGTLMLVPAVTGLVLLVTGLLYFHRAERRFADVI